MSSNIKTAQFGGVGGGYSKPYSPGSSPLSKGGGAPIGVNDNTDDNNTLNRQIERTHLDPNMSDDNLEKRLSDSYHKSYEKDNINYQLTPEERIRAKFRAKLHGMHQDLQAHADSIYKNSPEYIRQNFQPKPEHVSTYEQQLENRHQYKAKQKFDYEDEIVPQIKPSRVHYSISEKDIIKVAQEIQRTRRNRITDFDEGTYENEDIIPQFSYAPLGPTPILTDMDQEGDLDKYFKNQMKETTRDNDGYKEYKLKDTALDYPDRDTLPNVYPRKDIANEPADRGILKTDPTISLEGNLNPERNKKTTFDRNNITKEDGGVEEVYDGSAWFGVHTPATF